MRPRASAGRNRLPAGAALGYVRVIACRIGAVIPGLGRVGLAIVVAVVWVIAPPGVCDKSAAETLAPVGEAFVALAETIVDTGEATVKSTKSTAVKPTAATAETSTSTPAMRPGVGGIWLAQRCSAQQSGCGCQSPSYLGQALCSLDCCIEHSTCTGRISRVCDRRTRLLILQCVHWRPKSDPYLLHCLLRGNQQCAALISPI